MVHLRQINLGPIEGGEAAQFPFSVPAIRALAGRPLDIERPVTFLIGENGSGKSTLLEAVACAAGAVTVGSASAEEDTTLAAVRRLAGRMRLSWRRRVRRGFFMRSEDFFGFVKRTRSLREELERELAELDESLAGHSEYARQLARGPLLGQLAAMRERYGEDLDAASHGESYIALFKARFVPGGLYLLDEPEAPLSPMRQIALIGMLGAMVEEHDAQFIIATHSPILMALPGAALYSFDGGSIRPIAYEETEHYTVTKAFLSSPERFLRHL